MSIWRLVETSFLFGDKVCEVPDADIRYHDEIYEVSYCGKPLLFMKRKTKRGIEGVSFNYPTLFLVNETFKTHPDLWTRIKNLFRIK